MVDVRKRALISQTPFAAEGQPETIPATYCPPSIMPKSFSDREYAAKNDSSCETVCSLRSTGRLRGVNCTNTSRYSFRKLEEAGRPPISASRMLRMCGVQQCFGLSAEDIEDALHDSQSIRTFVGIDLAGSGHRIRRPC
jgi:hypothetical protein